MAVRNYPRAAKQSRNSVTADVAEARKDLMKHVRDYARENPEATALWCLGIGFVLGWKLKPW
ncbi:MAG: hypothetical protein JNG90_00965 [Planctomycetaceae bacterium]|nr:hypothetical protein [Planctomycetaceae bacterium]